MNDLKNNNKEKKENIINRIKASFTGRRFRSGLYVTMVSAIVIVMVLVVNLIMSKFDLKKDLSTNRLYTLTDDTKKVVKNLKDDVTIYYLVQAGSETTIFQNIVKKYDSLSTHIKLEEKDPELYPQFASQYVQDKISPDSFLVVNDKTKTAKYIDYNDLLVQDFDYNTYQSKLTGIDVEGKLTSAIQYVTSSNLPVLYETTGHSETETGDLFKTTLEKQNVTINTLNTLSQDIPKDCNILFINVPKSDFTEKEVTKIKDYMAAGGNVVAVIDYQAKELTNLNSLMEYYGMKLQEGIVCEGNKDKYMDYPVHIIPNCESHAITSNVIESKVNVVLSAASGLSVLDNVRSSLKLTPILDTSDKAYSKTDVNAKTFDKEGGDLDGPFNVGLVATDTYNNVTSNLIVYTSQYMFDDGYLKQFGNAKILTGTMGYLSGNTSSTSIPTKSLETPSIQISAQKIIFWGALAVVILPVAILTTGIVVSVRRRKR